MTRRIPITILLLAFTIAAHAYTRAHATYLPVPAGMVTFTSAGSCPAGWLEYTITRGRAVIGLPLSGSNQAITGTALTNGENRSVGQHSHPQNSHNHTQPAHGHVQDAHGHVQDAHTHTQNPHSHDLTLMLNQADLSTGSLSTVLDDAGTETSSSVIATNIAATATNIENTATNQLTTATNQSATATNQNAGSVVGTNVPYIQMMACEKQ